MMLRRRNVLNRLLHHIYTSNLMPWYHRYSDMRDVLGFP